MKHTILLAIVCGALTLSACSNSQKQLQKRATELCAYIPDHQLLERSQNYLTPDFYALLDTMFNHLPEHEAMDHEWLYYFVTGNGGTIANYTVTTVERIDPTHAVATVLVRQVWEDGSFDETTGVLTITGDVTVSMKEGVDLGTRTSFADIGATCAEWLGLPERFDASSFADALRTGKN